MTMGLLGITGDNITGELTNVTGISFDGGINTLDAYEEGTWTPELIGSIVAGTPTYSIQDGRYIRVGNLCTVFGRVALTAKTAISGNIRLEGLPFSSADGDNTVYYSSGGFGLVSNITGVSNVYFGNLNAPVSYVALYKDTSATAISDSDLTNTSHLRFAFTYLIN